MEKVVDWGIWRHNDKGATAISYLSGRALDLLWAEFSNIQHASSLIVDEESMERFKKWLESGDDKDAWS